MQEKKGFLDRVGRGWGRERYGEGYQRWCFLLMDRGLEMESKEREESSLGMNGLDRAGFWILPHFCSFPFNGTYGLDEGCWMILCERLGLVLPISYEDGPHRITSHIYIYIYI